MAKRLIVTADDLGLDSKINEGILKAHREGIVTSASLLVHAPATEHALALLKSERNLEVGIHLAFVESFAGLPKPNSLTDPIRYLEGHLCLHRHWKYFMKRYLRGAIRLKEIEAELESQIQTFLRHFSTIPFANATQHLHLLPGIAEIVIRLARKYKIKGLRMPQSFKRISQNRILTTAFLSCLSRKAFTQAHKHNIFCPDRVFGFDFSGRLNVAHLLKSLERLEDGTGEMVTHPGFDSPDLREKMPWAYAQFHWPDELGALLSKKVRDRIASHKIELTTFEKAAQFS